MQPNYYDTIWYILNMIGFKTRTEKALGMEIMFRFLEGETSVEAELGQSCWEKLSLDSTSETAAWVL